MTGTRPPFFEIVRTAAGFHTRFKAGNGQTIFTTEVYERRRTAEHAIAILDLWSHFEVREVDDRA